MKDLKRVLIELLKSTEKPMSVGNILGELSDEYDVRPSTIRQALRELEKDKKIVSFTEDTDSAGRPRKLYRPIEREAVREENTLTREAIERKNLLRDLIHDSAGRYSTIPFERVQNIFKMAAEKLLKEDPRVLFLQYANWLQERHRTEIDLYKKNRDEGLRQEAEKHRRNIESLAKFGDSVFTRMLGVPTQIREKGTLEPGPFRLKLNWRSLEDDSNIDNDELMKYISWSVYGPSVIEAFSISGLEPPIHVGGSDTSVQPITLSTLLPWLVERSEMNIITAVGVRYDIYRDVRDLDRQPEPKVLAEYERTQAIEEGLLIPPSGTLGYRPEMENRIREAAMDLRQYIKDFDLMFSNEPAVKISFRDGRIFPMEHRLSDALQLGLHGDMVRSALKAFRNITNIIGTENGETLYCGFVKRAGVAIVAPLVIWYIGFGSAEGSNPSLDPEMTLEDYLSSPFSDNYVVNQLFSVIRDKLGEDEVYITFRVLRRYQSMEEPIVQNFTPSADRKEWFQRLADIKSYVFGSSSEETGLELIANLCARAAVVQFYCSLSINPNYEPHARLPRIEFLLPFPDFAETLQSPQTGNEKQLLYLTKILSVIFYPGILVNYQDSLFYFRHNSPEVFLIPKPLFEAHDSAKLIANEYRDDFIELLIREARIYWITRTRGQSGFIV